MTIVAASPEDWKLPIEAYNKTLESLKAEGIDPGRKSSRIEEETEGKKIEEYKSIEDVLIQRAEIAQVSFKGLPGYNYVKLLVDTFIHSTDASVSYTHLRAHETRHDLVCRLL